MIDSRRPSSFGSAAWAGNAVAGSTVMASSLC
jgi:hypothetical protein